ncbi:unnamed protein product [Meloidogyne enterolobii]|uniref:Uncharacterized protein n=1 Tax=Meloidogyne enterolobii TaxID=390850 RepID=A0ACB0YYE0_MELEN
MIGVFEVYMRGCQSRRVHVYTKGYHALQEALEQVEKLQRKIFNLIQNNNQQINNNYFELIPSYDALYSFAAGLVKKLGQMRSLLSRKCFDEFQNELEINILKGQLLIANLQVLNWIYLINPPPLFLKIERQHFQLQIENPPKKQYSTFLNRRSISFNGTSFIERISNSKIKYFLPSKLYLQQKNKRKQTIGFDSLVEFNEQSIEMEFLRLFDSAWNLSRICDNKEENKQIINSKTKISLTKEQQQQFSTENFKGKILQRKTQSGNITLTNSQNNQQFKWLQSSTSSPPPLFLPLPPPSSPPKQQQNINKHLLNEFIPNNSPSGTPIFTNKYLQNNYFNEQKLSNRSRPILVRQNSTTKNEYDLENNCSLKIQNLISSKPTEKQNTNFITKSILHPPTPSAPPISLLLNSSTISRSGSQTKLPQFNKNLLIDNNHNHQLISSSKLNNYSNKIQNNNLINFPPPTSSTRRPLTRSGACTGGGSRSPTPKQLNNENIKSKSPFPSNYGGNRSASTSRLPKAVGSNTTNTHQIIDDPQQQQNTSDQFSNIGQMPKAVKKAGNSWLSRLRRKSVSNTATNN